MMSENNESIIGNTSNINFSSNEVFNQSLSIMLLVDPISKSVVDANKAACQFYGYSYKEITQLKISDINTLSEKEIKNTLQDAKKAKNNLFILKHKLKNGEIKDVEVYTNLIKIKDKEFFYSIIHDVTEKALLKKQLEDSRTKFNSIFNLHPHPSHLVDKEFNIVSTNKKLLELKNLNFNDIVGKKCYTVYQNREKICPNCNVRRLFNKNKIEKTEQKLTLSDGKVHIFETNVYSIKNNNDEITHAIETTIDITKQKIAEQLIEQSEEKYRLVTESVADCVFTIDLEGKFTYLNSAFEKITKFKVKDFIGTHFIDRICPEYKELILSNFENSKNGIKIPVYEIEIFDKNNKRIPIELNVTPLLNENKKLIGRVGSFRDITERKIAEEKTKQTEQNFKSLIEDAVDIIALINNKGIVKFANKQVKKVIDYTPEELIGSSFSKYILETDLPKAFDAITRVLKGEENVTFESSLIHKNGTKIPSCWSLDGLGICVVKNKIEWAKRLKVLADTITYWTNPNNISNRTILVIQLFYDDCG